MTHLERLSLTFAIIFASLAAGYICKSIVVKRKPSADETFLKTLRKKLQTIAVFGLLPLSAMFSLWGLPKPDSELLALPFLGLASYVWGGALALFVARMLKLNSGQTGSFFCCGTFTNIGAVGGLVCLLFLGENSIALVALYRLLDEAYYFSISIPIAKYFSLPEKDRTLKLSNFKFSPLLGVIIFALGCGLILNFLKFPRPEIFGPVASASMLIATVFFLFAIGLSLRLAKTTKYISQGLWMCAIKFIGSPLVVAGLGWLIGINAFDNGLALKTVLILSSMPVAMTALVPPSLFDLDVDMANACWIFSTAGLIIMLPALMFLLPRI